MTARIPTSWEKEEWTPSSTTTRPNPTAPVFSPRILHSDFVQCTVNGQPRTTYRPELKILKRAPGTPEVSAPVAPSEEIDKSRRERERKEKERRYREARERIMGKSTTPSTASSPTPTGTSTPKQQQKQRETSPDAHATTPKPKSPSHTPSDKHSTNNSRGTTSPDAHATTPKSKSPSQTPSDKHSTNNSRGTTPVSRNHTPSRRPSPPRVGGSVTSFSLNGGEFTAAPVVPARGRWQKVDEKLRESELLAAEDEKNDDGDMEGDAYLIDSESYSRRPVPMQQQQQRTGYGAGAGEYDYYNNSNYGNGNYGNGNGNYSNGNGNYSNGNSNAQSQSRPGQNPGAAVGEGRFVYDKPPSEKNVRAPGSMQAGVVQAVRAPRGPDGSRGFKERSTGPARNGVR